MKTISTIMIIAGGAIVLIMAFGGLLYTLYTTFIEGNIIGFIGCTGLLLVIIGFALDILEVGKHRTWDEKMKEDYDDLHRRRG